jgi:hypothetical protein
MFLENLIKISCFIDGKNSWIDKRHMKFINKKKNLHNLKFFFCNYKVREHFEGKSHTKVLQRYGVLISYILRSSSLSSTIFICILRPSIFSKNSVELVEEVVLLLHCSPLTNWATMQHIYKTKNKSFLNQVFGQNTPF